MVDGDATASLSQQLAAFAVAQARAGVPADVAHSARQRVTDVFGLQLAALDLDTSRAMLEFVADQGGAGPSRAVGLQQPVAATWAAFANGTLAHSLDYDDTHLPSVLHPSASVVPAAFAAAERAGVSGRAFIDAVAVGIEIVVRLGMAGYDEASANSVFFEHGQHATSICGAVGSAVAAGLVLGLDSPRLVDAIGIAASMASGIIEANRTGGTVKRIHCGWAAHAAVSAALLAACGITGPPTALEGRFGFFEAFLHGTVDLDVVTTGLGTQWSVPGIFFKPYPANHFTHTALDAARALRRRGVDPDRIEAGWLGVAAPTVRTIGEPLAIKQRPETGYQAQFSGPFAVAIGLLGGGGLGAALEDYTDARAHDARYRALAAKIEVHADDECGRIYPHQFPARLRVRTVDGDDHEEFVAVNRGGPDAPLTDAELDRKFRDNARRALDADATELLATALGTLADAPDVMQLSALLAGARLPT